MGPFRERAVKGFPHRWAMLLLAVAPALSATPAAGQAWFGRRTAPPQPPRTSAPGPNVPSAPERPPRAYPLPTRSPEATSVFPTVQRLPSLDVSADAPPMPPGEAPAPDMRKNPYDDPPAPNKDGAMPGLMPPANMPGNASTANPSAPNTRPTGDNAARREPIGEKPQDTSAVFLRQSTILLKPGDWQFDVGLNYGQSQTEVASLLSNNFPVLQRVEERRVTAPLTVRYGLCDRFETFCLLPVGMAALERSDPEFENYTQRFGIGDLALGVKYLLCQSQDESPDVILNLTGIVPTGGSPFASAGDSAAIGQGFWSLIGGVNVIQAYDPFVLFASLSYQHQFAREFRGIDVAPGEAIRYDFGFGLAVTDRFTLSIDVIGGYQFDTSFDGQRLPNSSTEPISLRLALTRRITPTMFWEPFASFGVTDDAGGFTCGMFLTYMWQRKDAE